MNEYQYCPKREVHCFKNVPFFTVISEWIRENHDYDFDFNPAVVIYSGFLCLIAWILIKIFFRIIKSMLKPLLFIGGLFIVMYTKQFSNSVDAVDFILNVIANTVTIFIKMFETVNKIVFV